MKRFTALAAVLTLVTALAGCGGSSAPATSTEPASSAPAASAPAASNTPAAPAVESTPAAAESIVRVGIPADPGGLSPFAGRSLGMINTYRTVYEYLVDRDSFGGEMVGCLMKSYKQVNDTTYDMELYDYIHDTAGNPLKASDVVFTMETAKASGNLPKLNVIESVTAEGEYTVRFVFTQALAVGELEAIWSENPIVTKAAYESSPDGMATNPVGTTAYAVTEYTQGSKIVLKDTGNYWQTDASLSPLAAQHNVDTIEFLIITEGAQRAIALETGAADLINGISSTDVGRFGDAAKYSTFAYMENGVNSLYFNCDTGKAFAGNQALREAIAYGIDVQSLVDGAYNGDGYVCKTLGSSKYGDYDTAWDSQPYFEYDLNKAKELLAEAGYPNGGLTLTLVCLNAEDSKTIATIIQGYLLQLGVDVKIESYDNAMINSIETSEPGEWDLYVASKASTDYLVNAWKLAWAAQNYNGHSINYVVDDELQRVLAESLTPAGHTRENVNAFHSLVKDNCYAIGLTTYNSYVVGTPQITNVLLDARNCIIPGGCKYSF